MKGPWRRDRYNVEFFSSCVMSVCGLLNLQIDNGEPVRKNLSTLRPKVANVRHAKKVSKQKQVQEVAGEESSEGEMADSSEEDTEDHSFHEIERIVSSRWGTRDKVKVKYYRVKFLGEHGNKDCTADNVTKDALDEFYNKYPKAV